MSLLKDLLGPVLDASGASYEERVRELIVFAGLIGLLLIVVYKRS